MIKIDLTVEQAERLQADVAQHMEDCYDYLDWINTDPDDADLPERYQEVDMFCGCNVCEMREHLIATFNSLRNMGIVDIAVE